MTIKGVFATICWPSGLLESNSPTLRTEFFAATTERLDYFVASHFTSDAKYDVQALYRGVDGACHTVDRLVGCLAQSSLSHIALDATTAAKILGPEYSSGRTAVAITFQSNLTGTDHGPVSPGQLQEALLKTLDRQRVRRPEDVILKILNAPRAEQAHVEPDQSIAQTLREKMLARVNSGPRSTAQMADPEGFAFRRLDYLVSNVLQLTHKGANHHVLDVILTHASETLSRETDRSHPLRLQILQNKGRSGSVHGFRDERALRPSPEVWGKVMEQAQEMFGSRYQTAYVLGSIHHVCDIFGVPPEI